MDEPILPDAPENKSRNMAEVLNEVFLETANDIQNVEMRWEKTIGSIFSSLKKTVSHFFVSRVKSDEVNQVQSSIRRLFMKSDYEEKIRVDAELQNVFLLGYCQAVEHMIDSFESAISLNENDPLKLVVSSRETMKPALLCLDKHFQLSHQELAEKIGVSKSSLSNFMKEVQQYGIFNSTRVGKKKYYTLSSTNGEKALRFVKEYDKSLPEGYTDCLLRLLSHLQEAVLHKNVDEEIVRKECENLFFQYTTKPVTCKDRFNKLFSSLRLERLYSESLKKLEKLVNKSVIVFTKNIASEEGFVDIITKNLNRKIKYCWFVKMSVEFDSDEKVAQYLYEKLSLELNDEACMNGFYSLISEEKMNDLLGTDSDVVIFDEKWAYSSTEDRIFEETPYNSLQEDELGKLREFVESNETLLHPIARNIACTRQP